MSDMIETPDRDSAALRMEDGGLAGTTPGGTTDSDAPPADVDWLALARRSYQTSTDWLDQGLRRDWERALDHFNSRHSAGSKYLSDSYKARSRLFRPKTRGYMRRRDSAVAAAFFSTNDVLSVSPVDDSDPQQRVAAKVNQELMQYRLTKTLPWFMICIGASQNAAIYGVCTSKQWWEYEEDPEQADPVTGAPKVIHDRPRIDLVAPENFRIDPAADWTDPVGTSPYIHHIHPMYVGDVKKRMKAIDRKTGQPKWKEWDDATIRKAAQPEHDNLRQARSKRERPDQQRPTNQPVGDFEMVNVHEVVIRHEGRDWVYWTLGTENLLTDPVPLETVYLTGERPWVMGYGLIETHKAYPFGQAALSHDLQVEINDLANLRMDNVRLGVNGRYFARLGADIDAQSLMRSTPGAVTFMKDPGTDVVVHRPPDVTGSSYQEQDRLNVDFDDVMGSFSPGSVQSNRKLNETVGGMALLSNSANTLMEFDLRVFSETWVEKVLRQLIKLEQVYETDLAVIALAGKKADVFQEAGMMLTPDLIEGEFTVTVNVGIGATDPNTKVQKFVFAMNTLGGVMQRLIQMYGPGVVKSPGFEEIASELFGLVGYKDASRFLDFAGPGPDPQAQQVIQQLQQQLQMAQGELQKVQQDAAIGIAKERTKVEGQIAVEQARTQGRIVEKQVGAQLDAQIGAQNRQMDREDAVVERQWDMADADIAHARQMQSTVMKAASPMLGVVIE